jgi:hypothetical protein
VQSDVQLSPDTQIEEDPNVEVEEDAEEEQSPGKVLGTKRKKSLVEDAEEDEDPTPTSGKSATKAPRTTKSSASDAGKGGKGGEAVEGEGATAAGDEDDQLKPDLDFKKSEAAGFYTKGGKKKVLFHQLLWDLQREHGQPRSLKQKIWMDYYREMLTGRLPTGPFSQCLGWLLNGMLILPDIRLY